MECLHFDAQSASRGLACDVSDPELSTKAHPKLTFKTRPVEISQVLITPSDFFTCNPAIDVPSSKNEASQLADSCGSCTNGTNGTNGHAQTNGHAATNGNHDAPVEAMQRRNVNGAVTNGTT